MLVEALELFVYSTLYIKILSFCKCLLLSLNVRRCMPPVCDCLVLFGCVVYEDSYDLLFFLCIVYVHIDKHVEYNTVK